MFPPVPQAEEDQLAILHLSRDNLLPVYLSKTATNPSEYETDDYPEGPVTNTRFGSFAHSTLIGREWGSQVLASKIDTGSRGKKRKRATPKAGVDASDAGDTGSKSSSQQAPHKAAEIASTGFAHLLPPTPEAWTVSLPHRTQVVYTPDYSFILHRLEVRPGSRVIEAGAGSGSFTHAAARCVFSGSQVSGAERGRVFSYEYHAPRAEKMREEISKHGLEDVVTLTPRDVYIDGFCLGVNEPKATAIFLDLPAPWLALRQLTRSPLEPSADQLMGSNPLQSTNADEAKAEINAEASDKSDRPFRSPLDPKRTVHICTFSPCIEQVQRTVTEMRSLGWVDIQMFEVAHRRIEIRRERVGLSEEGLRFANDSPASVDEALARLQQVEQRQRAFHAMQGGPSKKGQTLGGESKIQRLERNKRMAEEERKLYKEGRLVHRTEPDLKTHTSYLVFAILPRQWTAEDEGACLKRWGAERSGPA